MWLLLLVCRSMQQMTCGRLAGLQAARCSWRTLKWMTTPWQALVPQQQQVQQQALQWEAAAPEQQTSCQLMMQVEQQLWMLPAERWQAAGPFGYVLLQASCLTPGVH